MSDSDTVAGYCSTQQDRRQGGRITPFARCTRGTMTRPTALLR